MENKIFSDMKFIEPLNKIPSQSYMPFKQIGFFEDKLLKKNIISLKNNVEIRENFIKSYNSPKFVIHNKNEYLSKNSNEKCEKKREPINRDSKGDKENNIDYENDLEENANRKTFTQFSLNTRSQKEIKTMTLTKDSLKITGKNFNPSKTNFNKFPKLYCKSDKKETRKIQFISTKHKDVTIDHKNKYIDKFEEKIKDNNENNSIYDNKINLNIIENNTHTDNNNFNNTHSNLDKSKITNKSNILKNQIISGHFKKEIHQDFKGSEVSSFRNTLYSNFSPIKNEENDDKSILTKKENQSITYPNRNASIYCDHDSFRMTNRINSIKFFSKKDSSDSKIDFVYKKIFDKKSRMLIEKTILDKDANENKKKSKNKIDYESSDFLLNSLGMFKKKQYIEDKIQDIKRKIFFIKGVYDFSYPKIIVNKVKTAQDFYNVHHTEQKVILRESMNHTSQKFMENHEEKLRSTTNDFRKSLYVEKLNTQTNEKLDLEQRENKPFFEPEKKMIKSMGNLDFKPLGNRNLTLTNKFIHPIEITPFKVINPIGIKTIFPDLGEPSKLKVKHIPKIFI